MVRLKRLSSPVEEVTGRLVDKLGNERCTGEHARAGIHREQSHILESNQYAEGSGQTVDRREKTAEGKSGLTFQRKGREKDNRRQVRGQITRGERVGYKLQRRQTQQDRSEAGRAGQLKDPAPH
jgi:hypothetical protein